MTTPHTCTHYNCNMSDDGNNSNNDGNNANSDEDTDEAERGIGDYTSYQYRFPERCGHWTHSHVQQLKCSAVNKSSNGISYSRST